MLEVRQNPKLNFCRIVLEKRVHGFFYRKYFRIFEFYSVLSQNYELPCLLKVRPVPKTKGLPEKN